MAALHRRLARPTTASTTKRCAIYTRKSTTAGLDQEFNSLDAQRDACLTYIQREPGWLVIDERYDDGGYSGANTDRPAFQRLLADVDAGKIDVIVVYKIDRLSRSLLDFVSLLERLEATGTSFVSVTQQFSTATAVGRLSLNILMSFAEFEREMTRERTMDKIAGARRRGKWTGGTVPLGYRVVDKRLVVNELEAIVVRDIFTWYLAERSTLSVTRLLNDRHRGTKRHRASREPLREARAWTKNDVQRVLRNPVYVGSMPYGDELYKGEHEPIIEMATFEQVRNLLAGRNHATRTSALRNPHYLLRGVLRCACCGAGFTTASTRIAGAEYRYYRCITRDKQGHEACPANPLPASAIEDYVIEQLRLVVSKGDLASDVAAKLTARVAARCDALTAELRLLPGQLEELRAKRQPLLDLRDATSGSARDTAEARLRTLDLLILHYEQRLVDVKQELMELQAQTIDSAWVTSCLDDFVAVRDELTPENRLRLLQSIVQRIDVNEPENKVTIQLANLSPHRPMESFETSPRDMDARP